MPTPNLDEVVRSSKSRLCERSEAISPLATVLKKRDCRVAPLLAMTALRIFYETMNFALRT
jgi:hypothetical protein